ncbi:MAG: phosphodiester glycosidase family protein [Bacteroidales bacterium]|nr:phosphodiester glycosidase family protein [Bacteroidales bacterium]
MKKTITALMLSCAIALGANAKGTCDVAGTVYTVDTTFHAYIGPGTTQTSMLLQSGNKHLRVFYTTIDLTNPYVKIRAVSGTDMMAGGETVSQMCNRKTEPGQRYYVGVNGDFWVTAGTTARGQSMVGAPIASSMAKGVIYKGINGSEIQYSIDANQVPSIGTVTFGGTIEGASGKVSIGGVNTGAVNNAVTLYNPTYFSGTNESGVTEVQVRYVDGDDSFAFAKQCKLEVVNTPSSAGDMDVPSQGLVLTGKGSAASFIAGLKPGDQLTLTLNAYLDGKSFTPTEIVSGNPWVLNAGQVVNNGDTSVHPRTVLGYSQDGKKVIFLVVDGRSPLSDGATTAALGSLMKYAGAYQAVNVDGGGSTCLYSSALGVRNRPSDGSERADCNGIFAVSEAPDDSVIASIRYVDFSLRLPKYGLYTPKFYGYNQYGMLVDTDVKGVKLSCDEALGHIIADTTFYADGSLPEGVLTATFGDMIATITAQIQNSVDAISIVNDSVINDTFREYAIDAESVVGETKMPINPAALTWMSTDESVVTVGEHTGVLKGIKDGEAYVVGFLGEVCDTMKVIVERPTAHVMPLDPVLDVSTWKISQTGGKNAVATALGSGIDYVYTGASARGPKIVLTKSFRVWSLPDAIRITLNPGEAPVKNVVLGVRANGESMAYQTIELEGIEPNKEVDIDLPTSSWMDANKMGNYPIVLSSIQFNMNASTTGKEYHMVFKNFASVYNAIPETKTGDINGDGVVNVSDVTALINKILSLADFSDAVCDINADGVVNVSDVTALVNLILG